MKSWLSIHFEWPSEDPIKTTLKFVIYALPVIGLWLGILDLYIRALVSTLYLISDFIIVGYFSKTKAPKALALGYFKSFVEPVGGALNGNSWVLTKDTGFENEIPIPNKKQLDVKLKIVLPKHLAVKDRDSSDGVFQVQKTVNAKALGYIHLSEDNSDRERGYWIHYSLKNNKGHMSLEFFDMPNTLFPLRDIQFVEEPESKKRIDRVERRSEGAFKEFCCALEWELNKTELTQVCFLEKCPA